MKRSGKQEAVHFDKITSRVMKLSYGLNLKSDDIIEIAKKVIKKQGELRLNVSDLLNNEAIFYQNPDGASRKTYKKNSDDNVISTMKYGTNISLTFSYQFGLWKKK